MRYEFANAAAADMEAATDYYEAQAGSKLAVAFAKEVSRVATILAENPFYGKPREGGLRSFPLRRFPYSLIYSPTDFGVRIFAVAHQNRKYGYWADRS